MSNPESMLHDVGAQLAQMSPAPPPVVHDAARCAFRTMLGCPDAAATAGDIGSDPDLRMLLGAAMRLLKNHPEFWKQFYLQSARTAPLSSTHPWAAPIAQTAAATPAPVDPSTAAPPPTSTENGATPASTSTPASSLTALVTTGSRMGGRSMRGSAHGGRGRHPGVNDRFARGGPFGDGAFYIIDEQQSLDDVPSPSDGEPEVPAHIPGAWLGM